MLADEIQKLAREGATMIGELEEIYQKASDILTDEEEERVIELERRIRYTIRSILVQTLDRAPVSVAEDIRAIALDGNPRSLPYLYLSNALVRVSEGGKVGRIL